MNDRAQQFTQEGWSKHVHDFSWKVFTLTGSIDTYLLMKEIENDHDRNEVNEIDEEWMPNDAH